MSVADNTYAELLSKVLVYGEDREDRTGVGTKSLFGEKMVFDLAKDGFPLLTTKRLHWPSIAHELIWILTGSTNIDYLQDNGVRIWNSWADHEGDLGPVYGKQLRNFEGCDQLLDTIEGIRNNPMSRRHLISLWNAADLPDMALPPCHGIAIQFYVRNSSELDCQMYQRSADMFLGVPFNIASYALLLMMVAKVTGYRTGKLTWIGGDCHVYANHHAQVWQQLEREGKPAPGVKLADLQEITSFRFSDIELINYDAHPAIKAEVAV